MSRNQIVGLADGTLVNVFYATRIDYASSARAVHYALIRSQSSGLAVDSQDRQDIWFARISCP